MVVQDKLTNGSTGYMYQTLKQNVHLGRFIKQPFDL